MRVGNRISVKYHDGREFVGTITILEHQPNGVWSDGVDLPERTMIRIRNDKGNFQSMWLDKCVSVDIIGE